MSCRPERSDPIRTRLAKSFPGWLRLVTYNNPPGTGRMLRWLKLAYVGQSNDWPSAPSGVYTTRIHGYRAFLDLTEWSSRVVYFTGRYYEHDVTQVIGALLRPGDFAVDVGANYGMVTLDMAGHVGIDGKVFAFEPNPFCFERLARNVELNNLQQVELHPYALSDAASDEATLYSPPGDSGQGHLLVGNVQKNAAGELGGPTETVKTKLGDDVLPDGHRIRLIKIDTEGFETFVLRGLASRLQQDRPCVICEIIDGFQCRAGSSSAALHELMESYTMVGFALISTRCGPRRRLHITRCQPDQPLDDGNYLWLPREHKLASQDVITLDDLATRSEAAL